MRSVRYLLDTVLSEEGNCLNFSLSCVRYRMLCRNLPNPNELKFIPMRSLPLVSLTEEWQPLLMGGHQACPAQYSQGL